MHHHPHRRRFLQIAAAAAGLPLLTIARDGRAEVPLHRWQGTALGARASLTLAHPDRSEAERLIAESVAELERLEGIFSLYRPDSALCRLNRDGGLAEPPLELVALLEESARFSRLSEGAFDVTVQPLWRLYAEHFAAPNADPAGPPAAAIAAAKALVDWRGVEVTGEGIRLARPGMAVTLNGIAQGFVTDRIADRLRAAGLTQVLADLGEIRALGSHPSGRPWRAGLADPQRPGAVAREVPLTDAALATSAASGTPFEPTGRFHHLLDPMTGASAQHWLSVSVTAPRAVIADALSTTLSIVPPDRIPAILAAATPARAWLTGRDGRMIELA
ncbi:FAD:protein FMN transferase [Benzoatithermus flavus]|uniref:FAD:protein FMN transferase n=1 Tax=Benzoatithermus flavus TaxID=3108223 RepID=A0ABU8XRU8_9PROT